MSEVVATVGEVARVEGISKSTGKAYTKFVVHANGTEYATFDGALANAAMGLKGKRATLTYEDSKFGKDLKAISEADSTEDFRAVTDEGTADWDIIGMQKVRCAIWKEIIAGAMQAAAEHWVSAAPEANDANNFAGFVARVGVTLRKIAEADIYADKRPAQQDEWIGF